MRNKKRDYDEITAFTGNYIGRTALDCIEAYAKKRKIVEHRAGSVFWDKVDQGIISTESVDGVEYIKDINKKEEVK